IVHTVNQRIGISAADPADIISISSYVPCIIAVCDTAAGIKTTDTAGKTIPFRITAGDNTFVRSIYYFPAIGIITDNTASELLICRNIAFIRCSFNQTAFIVTNDTAYITIAAHITAVKGLDNRSFSIRVSAYDP